jgi:hypothetical protein
MCAIFPRLRPFRKKNPIGSADWKLTLFAYLGFCLVWHMCVFLFVDVFALAVLGLIIQVDIGFCVLEGAGGDFLGCGRPSLGSNLARDAAVESAARTAAPEVGTTTTATCGLQTAPLLTCGCCFISSSQTRSFHGERQRRDFSFGC